jgi:hypothetical protein
VRQNLHVTNRHDSIVVSVAVGAFGAAAAHDDGVLDYVRQCALEDDDQQQLQSIELQLQALACKLQIDITILHYPMQTGHPLLLQPEQLDAATIAQVKRLTTYRASLQGIAKITAARHIVLQTVSSDGQQLVVDLLKFLPWAQDDGSSSGSSSDADDDDDVDMNAAQTQSNTADSTKEPYWPEGVPLAAGMYSTFDANSAHDYYTVTNAGNKLVCYADFTADSFENADRRIVARRQRQLTSISSTAMPSDDDITLDDGTNSSHYYKLQLQMDAMVVDARKAATVNSTTAAVATAAEAEFQRVGALVEACKESLRKAQLMNVYVVGAAQTGKSTVMSAMIQQGLPQSADYYAQFITAQQPAGVSHKFVKAVLYNQEPPTAHDACAAMTALCAEMKQKAHDAYELYDLNSLLSAQRGDAVATTVVPVLCQSSGNDVPSITVTFKTDLVTHTITIARTTMHKYHKYRTEGTNQYRPRSCIYIQGQVALAVHTLGKTGIDTTMCRQQLGFTAATASLESSGTGAADSDSDNYSVDTSEDEGHEETKGSEQEDTDTASNSNRIELKLGTDFDQEIDYLLPPTVEAYMSKLYGTTMRIEVRADNATQLVEELTKLLIMLTAPTHSVWALYGLIDSVVVRLPSATLLDRATGLRTVLHDLPGINERDSIRTLCTNGALSLGLRYSGDHAVIVHVIDSYDTPNAVFDSLSGAGVLQRLMIAPTSLRIVLVLPCDRHGDERMNDADVATVQSNRTAEYRSRLHSAFQQINNSITDDTGKQAAGSVQSRVDAAMQSIMFVAVESHPSKVSAMLHNSVTTATDDTTAVPQVNALCDALRTCGVAHWDKTLVSVLHELVRDVAQQSYKSYQAAALHGDDAGSSSGAAAKASAKASRVVKDKIGKIKTLLGNEVSGVLFVLLTLLHSHCRTIVCFVRSISMPLDFDLLCITCPIRLTHSHSS